MMDGTYKSKIDTPMGQIEGKVTLITDRDNNLSGYIDAMGKKNEFTGGKVVGNQCTFSGKLGTILGSINYTIQGTVVGDTLKVIIDSNKGKFNLEGKRI